MNGRDTDGAQVATVLETLTRRLVDVGVGRPVGVATELITRIGQRHCRHRLGGQTGTDAGHQVAALLASPLNARRGLEVVLLRHPVTASNLTALTRPVSTQRT